jgi:AmmeMemoRadiSam system protein A
MTLSTEERALLLDLAREAVTYAARGEDPPTVDMDEVPEGVKRQRASFVTLKKHGQLRGCIGSLEARRPLVLDVQQNAVGAAMRDPRFPRVRLEEVDELTIELSVLSEPEPLRYESVEDLCRKLRPGVDGVVIARGWQRATFLPQVWEKLPDERQFLDRLCLKAGLTPQAYASGDVDVYTYQVQKFGEE